MVLLCDQSSEGAFQRVARADQFCQSQDESLAGTGSDLRDLVRALAAWQNQPGGLRMVDDRVFAARRSSPYPLLSS